MTPILDFGVVSRELGLEIELEGWRDEFSASAEWAAADPAPVATATELAALCESLGIEPDVTAALHRSRSVWDDPPARRLAQHGQWKFVEGYDPGELLPNWPALFHHDQEGVRLLWAYAALGLAPRARSLHEKRGVSPAVSAATLADIGRQTSVGKQVRGRWCMDEPAFVAHHLNGRLYRLGRLQFQARAWFLGDHGRMHNGTPVLDVHIPGDAPLHPTSCGESFGRARTFFDDHMPEHEASAFTCLSWLLDEQLADVLPADSNIVSFQDRFERLHMKLPVRSSILEFVFRMPPELESDDGGVSPDTLAALPANTRLQRAVRERLGEGGRWWMTPGWFPL